MATPTLIRTSPNISQINFRLSVFSNQKLLSPNYLYSISFLPMPIQTTHARHYFTYLALTETLEIWDISGRIADKYPTWQLRLALPKLSAEWMQLIRHSLLYYLLKNLSWILQDFENNRMIEHSFAMKQHYTRITLKNTEHFDFKLIVLVKTISYFIGSHFHEVLADATLENDIYQLIIHNLLGIPIEPFAYHTLLKQFKSTAASKKERQSRDLDIVIDQSNHLQIKPRSLQLQSRRHAKKPTPDNLLEITEIHSNLQEIRSILKENLHVKPILRPPTPKYSINKLRQLENAALDQHCLGYKQASQTQFKRDFPKTKQTIMSNQLSNAFQFNSTLQLKDVKGFQIQRSTPKLQPMRHSFNANSQHQLHKKLEIKREDTTKPKIQAKSGLRSINSWHQTITKMKNELYTGKFKDADKNSRELQKYDDQNGYLRIQSRDNGKRLRHKGSLEGMKDSVKFRKLDLMNSPNVVVCQQVGGESKEQEVMALACKNYSLFHVQMPAVNVQLDVERARESRILHRNSSLFQIFENEL